MKEITKIKIKFYSIVAAVFLIIIFLLTCYYQIMQYDRRPAFNAIDGIVAVRRIVKNDLDYLKMKDNLYLCKDGKGAELITNEFASYKNYDGITDPNHSDDDSIFKHSTVVTKDGKEMMTYAGVLEVPEGKFHFIVLKEFE